MATAYDDERDTESSPYSARESEIHWRGTVSAPDVARYCGVWTRFPVLQAASLADEVTRALHQRLYVSFRALVFSSAHFDEERLMFKTFSGDTPSTYAMEAALRLFQASGNVLDVDLFSEMLYQRTRHSAKSVFRRWVEFIFDLRTPGQWQYGIAPGTTPSVFGTLMAFSVMRQCDNVPQAEVHNAALGLVQPEMHYRPRSGCFAFKAADVDAGCLSTTYHALRLARLLRDVSQAESQLDTLLYEEAHSLMTFVRACWDSRTGGFHRGIGSGAPDLTRTRQALALIGFMIEQNDDVRGDLEWLDLGMVQNFVRSCKSRGGFGSKPRTQPNLRALRDVVSIGQLICQLRKEGVGERSSSSLDTGSFREVVVADALAFVDSCLVKTAEDGKELVEKAYMCPVRVVDGWAQEGLVKALGAWNQRDINKRRTTLDHHWKSYTSATR